MTPPYLWLILIAIVIMAYEMAESAKTQYRKGCSECADHKRRADERQRELQHDYQHKGGWGCDDKSCPRNRVD